MENKVRKEQKYLLEMVEAKRSLGVGEIGEEGENPVYHIKYFDLCSKIILFSGLKIIKIF